MYMYMYMKPTLDNSCPSDACIFLDIRASYPVDDHYSIPKSNFKNHIGIGIAILM